jgi:hypothetical protein
MMGGVCLLLLLAALGGCSRGTIVVGHSRPARIALLAPSEIQVVKPPKHAPGLPAYIELLAKGFEEPSGNRALDSEEEGVLSVQLRNSGLGPGKVAVRLTPLGSMDQVAFRRNIDVGVLDVGDSVTVRVPIVAGREIEDGALRLRVEVIEEYNRAEIPFVFSFETRGLVVPEFRVILRDYDDGRFYRGNSPDGLVQAGELIRVVANVQNLGGPTDGVYAVIELDGIGARFFRSIDAADGNVENRVFKIGRMETGQSQDVVFYFSTGPMFGQPKVEIELQVHEVRERFGAEETLSFDIGESVRTQELLAVQAVEEHASRLRPVASDLIDVEQIRQDSKTRLDNGIAIIFGIEDYKHTFDAAYKSRDAAYFYRYCREVLGIPEERILLRTDSDATKAEFDYVFEPKDTQNQGWLKKRTRDPAEAEKTDVFVYLAGHGFPDLGTGQPYLIPYDVRPEQATNGVSLEQVYQTLSEFGARSVTVFVESCFSGASGYNRGGAEQLLAVNMNPVFPVMEQPMIGPETVVFSATSGKTPSNNRDDLKHGIFTYFVLQGLGGAADLDGDSSVTVGELFQYVQREVPRKALEPPLDREQVPQLLPSVARLGKQAERVLVEY